MSGQARRIKKLEAASDPLDAGYWLDTAIRSINGDEAAKAEIEAVVAAGGSPGYRAFQATIDGILERARERERVAASLSETDYAGMGAA